MASVSQALQIAVEHHRSGRLAEAEQIYRQILAALPDQPNTLHLLGLIALQRGDPQRAVGEISRAIELQGNEATYYNNLGEAYRALGQLREAATAFRDAIALRNEYAEAHSNLGNVLRETGEIEESIRCCRRALEIRPQYAKAWLNLGTALCEQGKIAEAIPSLERALELTPDFPEGLHQMGYALCQWNRLDKAIPYFRRAIEINPGFAMAHNNLGSALWRQGKLAEALVCCQRALELQPAFADACNNLSSIYKSQGHLEKSRELVCQALAINPNHALAHWNLSLLELLLGEMKTGWREYEWRWKLPIVEKPRFSQPLWDGSALQGKTILIHAEQGLGDTLQFIRYLPMVKARGGKLVFECQRPLLPLLEKLPVDVVVRAGELRPEFDFHAPLMSLPRIFQTEMSSIPASIPYLSAAEPLVENWRTRLAAVQSFRVGIAWQGSPENSMDRYRSTRLENFASLASVPRVQLISLQNGFGIEQLAEVRSEFSVLDFSTEMDKASGPFMDTAAIMMNLDLVVTTDSAVAHLAGALGVPVWIALPRIPDWRWFLERRDCPWYPTATLFRQAVPEDWPGVFAEMHQALAELVSNRRHSR